MGAVKYISAWSVLLFLLLSATSSIKAEPTSIKNLPEALKPWVPWVLHEQKQQNCPFLYNQFQQRHCVWPYSLKIYAHETGGRFIQALDVYQAGWTELPGKSGHWAQNVTIKGKPVPVRQLDNRSEVWLDAGTHEIEGLWEWDTLPEFLEISPNTGLIELWVGKTEIRTPRFDTQGMLWLNQPADKATPPPVVEEDSVRFRVFRLIEDQVPLLIHTHLELDVSGKTREIEIDPGTFGKTIAFALNSPLAVRMEENHSMKIQVRPGHWNIRYSVRSSEPLNQLRVESRDDRMPKQEIWSFFSHPELRVVQVEGGTSVDPGQTSMPPEWRNYPAWLVLPGEALTLNEKKRGRQPEPDQLGLERQYWLNFEGTGFSVLDQLQGQIRQGTRLDMNEIFHLDRVTLNGRDQLITRIAENAPAGIEVRPGQINVQSESSLIRDSMSLPVVGWKKDLQSLNARLHLPPGWTLWGVQGTDTTQTSWIDRWTLLDLFVVFLIVFASFRLWGWKAGLLTMVTMTLIYQEPQAPRWVFLHILGAVALLRVLPVGKFRRFVHTWRILALVSLIFAALPFMIQQLRQGLYPQLENQWQVMDVETMFQNYLHNPGMSGRVGISSALKAKRSMPMADEQEMDGFSQVEPQREMKGYNALPEAPMMLSMEKQEQDWNEMDPKSQLQTGSGIPLWHWQTINLGWNGPVPQNQKITLWLTPPWVNLLLAFLKVILLGVMIVFFLEFHWSDRNKYSFKNLMNLSLSLFLLLGVVSSFSPSVAQAQFPPEGLLKELQNRLTRPPECLPQCATVTKAWFEMTPDELRVRYEVHALEHIVMPLGGSIQSWKLNTLMVNGKPSSITRLSNGQIATALEPGIQQIIISGKILDQRVIDFNFEVIPQRVTVTLEGWRVEGILADNKVGPSLQFFRLQKQVKASPDEPQVLQTQALPPFLQVKRELLFELTWKIQTTITPMNVSDSSAIVEIPLLEGESVMSEAIQVKNGKALIHLAPGESTSWNSTLRFQEQLELKAPSMLAWQEVWLLNVKPVWHVDYQGIPPLNNLSRQGLWVPEWRPWPEESIQLSIHRPEAVEGATMTVDYTQLHMTPGQRHVEYRFKFHLRSSKGGEYTIRLPEDSQLNQVLINRIPQVPRMEQNQLVLPVMPGNQIMDLSWNQQQDLSTQTKTPALKMATPVVNSDIQVRMPGNRWILWVSGPLMGPAVLFWGTLLIILLVSVGLGKTTITPLKSLHWILLGLGLAPVMPEAFLLVTIWLFAIGWRRSMDQSGSTFRFNILQLGLVLLTFGSLGVLLYTIQQGLLGSPQMQISGNGSNGTILRWYQDQSASTLTQAQVISLPLWVYRGFMLFWAIWLASMLISWGKWSWECFSTNGYWKTIVWRQPRDRKSDTPNKLQSETPEQTPEQL
ncbi:MAG: hypothetical protein HQM11_14790 [SAR324 cluster bacterium]|nr:hypothetical protein [SAR324 cluster bacterium]